jgi:2-polyprenyl-3-methyl-5-hydroxy-6-metoxy-1,4-benzoquinol methylase
MKSFYSFFFLLFVSLATLNGHSLTFNEVNEGWNCEALAKMYFHHSEMQRQWAWESLKGITFSGDEKILDFGCGDGKISAEMARLAKNGSVLGIDISKEMIHLANIHFSTISNLAFKNSQSLICEDIPGKNDCDLVCAFTVFHLISNPLEVLKNLKAHLKASGKILLALPVGNNKILRQAAEETFAKYGLESPWKKKSEGPSMRTQEGCQFFLQAAGYKIESMHMIDTANAFYDLEDFAASMMGTATATWNIPFTISKNFFTDVVQRMYELDPTLIDHEGRVCFKNSRLHVIATPKDA